MPSLSQLTMLSFTCCCFVFPLSPGGVTYLASTTATAFTSPGRVSCLTCSGIQDLFNTATFIKITVPSRKRAHYEMSAHPPLWLNFLLRSSAYSNMCPCVHVAALESAAQMHEMAGLNNLCKIDK